MNSYSAQVDRLCQLSQFDVGLFSLNIAYSTHFNVREWTLALSEPLIEQSKKDSAILDPQPLIRHFEAALASLQTLQEESRLIRDNAQEAVDGATKGYHKRLKDLEKVIDNLENTAGLLETKVSEIDQSTSRLGDQIGQLAREREKSQATKQIVQIFSAAMRKETKELDNIKKNGKDGPLDLAIMLRRLDSICAACDFEGSEIAKETILQYSEAFEQEMFKLLDRSLKKSDPLAMKQCSRTLMAFNGGASCINRYVNQHDFFMSIRRVAVADEEITEAIWDRLSSPVALPEGNELSRLESLYSEIRAKVDEEGRISEVVFPQPQAVMQVFLQRVFAQVIQSNIERLVTKAQSISTLAYLRVIHMARKSTMDLIEDIKKMDLFSKAPPLPAHLVNMVSAIPIVPLPILLQNLMDELFMPFLEGSRYLEVESKNLSELYSTYLTKFTKWHEATHKTNSTSLLNRMAAQFAATAEKASANSPRSAALLKLSGLATDKTEAEKAALDIIDSYLDLDVAERILKWHAEAINRCVDLSQSDDLSKNAVALLDVLAEAINKSYTEVAVDTALHLMSVKDVKGEPDIVQIEVITPADLVTQIWQEYARTAILPLVEGSIVLRRKVTELINSSVSLIEKKLNALIVKLAEGSINYLSIQLQKQKKLDFKPKDMDASFARINTDACLACCEFLPKIKTAGFEHLNGRNLELFLLDIGINFHALLLDHFKKFPVDPTGSIMLIKDIALYQEVINTFGLPVLNDRFNMLRHLGIIFSSQLDSLANNILNDEYLGRLEPTLLWIYMQQRSDANLLPKSFAGGIFTKAAASGPISNIRDPKRNSGSFGLLNSMSNLRRDYEGIAG